MTPWFKNWADREVEIKNLNKEINNLSEIIGWDNIGRYAREPRFNSNLLDLEAFYFSQLEEKDLTKENNSTFLEGFNKLTATGSELRKQYGNRYFKFCLRRFRFNLPAKQHRQHP